MKKALIGIFLVIISQWIFAASSGNFPVGCKPQNFKFHQKLVILNTQSTHSVKIFLLHNISKNDFLLNHPVAHVGASAGWASEIHAGNWSAFSPAKSNFALSCSSMDASQQQFSCKNLLQVCALTNVHSSSTLGGSFWVAEDQSLSALLAAMQKRGIEFN